MSKVAVWLTNYANEKHLGKAIESVLKQTHQDFVLFIFDNHSPGGAREIIANYAAANRGKIVDMLPPKGLAGIPLMAFAWNYLNQLDFDYSITLGGHDLWPNERHLETLVNRAENEKRLGLPFALIYCDTWQCNDDDQLTGRFLDNVQVVGFAKQFIPQIVVSTVNSPQLFGLWNEEIRKKVPIRHLCAGWDHLVVMNAALHGAILYEGSTGFVMRAPPPDDHLGKYGERHFSAEARKGKDQDFINQLEWVTYCVREGCKNLPPDQGPTHRSLLTASMFATYLCLRGYNLHIFEGGMDAFQHNPEVQRAIKALYEAALAVNSLVRT